MLCSGPQGMHHQLSTSAGSASSRSGSGLVGHWENHRHAPCAAASSDVGGSGGPPASLGEAVDAPWRSSVECSGGTTADGQLVARGGGQGAGSHGLRSGSVCMPEFECTVLTHATWLAGGESVSDLSLLPPSLHWSVDAFTSFYLSRHSGRVLKFALEEVGMPPTTPTLPVGIRSCFLCGFGTLRPYFLTLPGTGPSFFLGASCMFTGAGDRAGDLCNESP